LRERIKNKLSSRFKMSETRFYFFMINLAIIKSIIIVNAPKSKVLVADRTDKSENGHIYMHL